MPFSSLPPELVHQIIESTIPHSFHTMTYKERQRTLCQLSLVSRQFRQIAQPLLLEIVKLERVEDAEKLPTARAFNASTRPHGVVRWLFIELDQETYREQTQEEEDRFADSLRVFESLSHLTVPCMGKSLFEEFLLMTSPHLTYFQITDYWLEVPEAIHLPNLLDLTLYHVSPELFDSLLTSAAVPNLRNFALVEASDECARWVKESSTSAFLLRLETLLIDAVVWLELDESFRQSAASRTLVDVSYVGCERASSSTASIVHARLDCTSMDHEDFDDEEFCDELDDYAILIEATSSRSLESFYLDSSFSDQLNLSQSTQLSINKLARICQERKIDLVFDQVPLEHTTDPCMSSEFIRRQKINRRNEVGAHRGITGQE